MAEVILIGTFSFIFSLLISRASFFTLPGIPKAWLVTAFLLKVTAGLLSGIFHEGRYSYGGDPSCYFQSGETIHHIYAENPKHYFRVLTGIGTSDSPEFTQYYDRMYSSFGKEWDPERMESRTIIRINAIIRWFSFGYYQVHVVFFSFIAFTGLALIFHVFSQATQVKRYLLFPGIFLMPSILFWSSGIFKESLVLFPLGLLLFSLHRLISGRKKIAVYFTLLIAIYLMLITKAYLLLLLLPSVLTWYWEHRRPSRHPLFRFLFIHALLAGVAALLIWLYNPDLVHLVADRHNRYLIHAQYVGTRSLFESAPMEPGLPGILQRLPEAAFNSLFRPWISDLNSPLALVPFAENMGTLLLLFIAVLFLNRSSIKNPLVLLGLFLTALIFILIGLTSPVWGSIIRFKAPFLALLIPALLAMMDTGKIKKFIRKTRLVK